MAAKETHTTARPVRIPKEDWDDFGALVGERERSRLIREFVAWYLRRPKATLPKRPDAGVHRTDDGAVIVDFKSTHRAPGH
jgi:hypothetical protein